MTIVKRGRRTVDNISTRQEETRKKQRAALDLRQAGATYREIAETVGYASHTSAHRAVQRALKNQAWDDSKNIILLDLQRLDEMQKRATHRMRTKDDLSQIHTILSIMDRRYRLTGVSSETAKLLAEQFGVDIQQTDQSKNSNNVMVIQQTETDEKEFISRMMEAANIDPESPEAQEYFKKMESSSPKNKKGGGGKKSKKKKRKVKVVRNKKENPTTQVEQLPALPEGGIEEADIVEAEIVDE